MSSDFDPSNIQKVKLSELIFNDWNPKDNEKEYEKVRSSIALNGMMTPVFVRRVGERYEIVDGNHRARAAKELGYSEIYIYNLGEISEAEAKKTVLFFQLQVNFDRIMLAPLALELQSVGMELPFSEKEMEKFAELEAFDMNTAFGDEEPVPEIEKENSPEKKLKTYKIKLFPEDFDLVRSSIDKVILDENVNEGRALELLLEIAGEYES